MVLISLVLIQLTFEIAIVLTFLLYEENNKDAKSSEKKFDLR